VGPITKGIQEVDEKMIAHDDIQGWHLDKRIGVAHILTTFSLVVALGSIMWALETRVTQVENRVEKHEVVMEVELKSIKDQDREMMRVTNQHYLEILRRLERIEERDYRQSESKQ
jgi:hypothetical protein